MSEDFAKIEKLSAEVLRLSRNTILINLRFMDAALAELELVPSMLMRGMATDGKRLIYNPMDILKAYADERYVINRDYLHVLLHCLYRHNFVNELLDEAVWDLACDITVENIINELLVSSLDAKRMNAQGAVISELKKQGASGNFTRSENLHITLAFIGETSRVAAAKACLERIDFTGFDLRIGGGGNFGDLYWVGIEKNPSLSALASFVRSELISAGFAIDEKPFKPHITVARRLSSPKPPRFSAER